MNRKGHSRKNRAFVAAKNKVKYRRPEPPVPDNEGAGEQCPEEDTDCEQNGDSRMENMTGE